MYRRLYLLAALAVALPLAVASAADQPASAATELEAPRRVLDTRTGLGADRGTLDRGEVLHLTVPDVAIEGDTTVLVNLTTVGAAAPGHISAWPCGAADTDTSIINFQPGRAVPNMVALDYTSEGLCFRSTSSVHVIGDLTAVTTNGEIRGVRPQRVLDTRPNTPFRGGREYPVAIGGTPGIPAGAAGAAVNVTVVRPDRAGHLLVAPCGSRSDASTVNFLAGEIVPHFTFTKLVDGELCITSSVDVDVIVDTFAWTSASSDLRMIDPGRLLDTRSGLGGTQGSVRDGQTVRLRVAGEGGVPNDAAGVTVNVVATGGSAHGYVAAWPCHVSRPDSSTLNLWPGMLRSNQAAIQLSPSGELCLRATIADTSRVHLVVDAVGYLDGDIDRSPPPATTLPPSSDYFETLPPGATLPSGAECAARVRPAAEIRPENAGANNTRGTVPNTRSDWSGFQRVDGDFAGTTDEIIQWAACKWGIDEDMVRAQVVKESWWYQSANGDHGQSWGLGQVRDTAHQSAFIGSVNARTSSAYNLDYTYASWRACFEGVYGWLNHVEGRGDYGPGDAWGCMGVWFSGRWYTQAAINYLENGDTNGYGFRGVKTHLALRTWEDPNFVNG